MSKRKKTYVKIKYKDKKTIPKHDAVRSINWRIDVNRK